MRRAALYARYSTDLQADRSIEDQLAVLRAYAARDGMSIVATFEDRAVSGASMVNRPGIQALMQSARAGGFDLVLVETLSRLGRDKEDRAGIHKRLKFAGVSIVTPSDGVVTDLVDGIRAIIDSQYLDDLKTMIRRGMAGIVRDGRHAGGRAYGYRPIPGRLGELAIDEREADTVRRIFAEYVGGATPRAIAAGLNADGTPPPRGRHWNASTINGSSTRGNGIIRNELYAGVIVWNRVRMVKDPDTGRRVSRPNAGDQVQRQAAEHLRIVDASTWSAAQARQLGRARGRAETHRRPPRLLSGLLRCGACGAGMASLGRDASGKTRVQCSAVREAGTCSSGRRVYLDEIERTTLAGLRERLADREYLAAYVQAYSDERRRLAAGQATRRGQLERRAGEIARELDRAVQAILKGLVDPETLRSTIAELQAERDRVAGELAELQAAAPTVVTLHPGAIADYRGRLAHLAELLDAGADGRDPAATADLVETVRRLVSRITVHAPAGRGGFSIDVEGRLAELVEADVYPRRKGLRGGTLVAEERYSRSPPIVIAFRFTRAAA